MGDFLNTIRHIPYTKEKKRFLLFALLLFLTLFLSAYLFKIAYARYEVRAKINANIEKALYIFEDETISFNLEPEGIIPSNDDYTYKFSVSNYNANKHSDVDLSYNVKVRTTTNLPIEVKMYRNELPTASGAVSLFQGATTEQDEDDAWYRLYNANGNYMMNYVDNVTDIYTMVIKFPATYSNNMVYANYLESIEVILESKQVI